MFNVSPLTSRAKRKSSCPGGCSIMPRAPASWGSWPDSAPVCPAPVLSRPTQAPLETPAHHGGRRHLLLAASLVTQLWILFSSRATGDSLVGLVLCASLEPGQPGGLTSDSWAPAVSGRQCWAVFVPQGEIRWHRPLCPRPRGDHPPTGQRPPKCTWWQSARECSEDPSLACCRGRPEGCLLG